MADSTRRFWVGWGLLGAATVVGATIAATGEASAQYRRRWDEDEREADEGRRWRERRWRAQQWRAEREPGRDWRYSDRRRRFEDDDGNGGRMWRY